ncbi:subtilisin-like serine germination related protease [[Clostridium] sordellii]|uniref:Subtilisin-like serine germination related protease n=1 Tax=Paraclostridium sordellii TaxID=1505 RepID=A0ABP1XQ07_PARSO|nr:bile acid germinant receptor pseudoprotease CspC [Paeniclostridium sordellii]CEJ73278.1 Subtilisin-like serine germination related protease [[Clostridium] sordellii] [Paeniclostridium sordellii]CEN68831.1 subtilisin-like serine germination related protease [[Clostridium] sordellii] [Paeniclostridium sordellii]CEN72098.1 subtilisin-like serine germination related protease [[Clostridium] sordellii] [Paeniclostridium sordellii]CEO23121.1 subtilisin-like serine germination related protease [[Clo
MEKSYLIIYQGKIEDVEKDLKSNGIERYVIINNQLLAIYVPINFREEILTTIETVAWWQRSMPMSSLIEVTNNMTTGVSITDSAGTDYIYKNPYITTTGKEVLIAIIDSGIDYLHPDFINENNTSKIVSIWDQESNKKQPPKGFIFGSEFTREDINTAIMENDKTLSVDNIGTGTIAAGISSGNGRLNSQYKGVAVDSELVVVKLREYKDTYTEGRINYQKSDFLSAISYVLDVAKREDKFLIINFTIGLAAKSIIELTLLETFREINEAGVIFISGAGNEGNTDIHYEGNFSVNNGFQDIIIQVGQQKNLDITLTNIGPDKIGASIISPSGELSYQIMYSPDYYVYRGKFNLEDTDYEMRLIYPWLESAHQELTINLFNIKPGIWTLRLIPEFILNGSYDVYLPNKNLISSQTRFSDPASTSTITMYAATEKVITIGAYNDKTDSIWIGSSKGPVKQKGIKPDIVAPGIDIISPYIDGEYNTSTGTGVSSSIVSGVIALIVQYIREQNAFYKEVLYTQQLKTYLMLGATKKDIYEYPNISQGYGILNLKDTIIAIANNFE